MPRLAPARQTIPSGGPYRVDVVNSGTESIIMAGSRRKTMDWSLVLASQDIPTTIVKCEPSGWGLLISTDDHARALEAIRLYRLENRRWSWRRPIPGSEAAFNWGSLGWCFLLILIHWLTLGPLVGFRSAGQFDSQAAAHGQWWRAFTAILLHADAAHLLANVSIGFLLLGLAMARYGPGPGLFAAYLAGALGNLAGLLLYPKPYVGLGASGMVLGALGLLAAPPWHGWSRHPNSLKQLIQAVCASIMLFILLGTDPASDIIAHLGGFVGGACLGLLLSPVPAKVLKGQTFTLAVWLAFAAVFTLTTCLALRAP
jgi:rhomboid protease GluP